MRREGKLPVGVRAYLQDYMASDVAPVLRKKSTWNRNLMLLILASVVFLAAIGEQHGPLNDQTQADRTRIVGDMNGANSAVHMADMLTFIETESANRFDVVAQVKP